MTRNLKFKIIFIQLSCAFIIGFPFFYINYFETEIALKYTFSYFIIPIIIISFVISIYFDKLTRIRSLKITFEKNHVGKYFQAILLTFVISLILFGITYSTIITTNTFIGKHQKIELNEKILDYYTHNDKYGFTRKYIRIINPVNKDTIDLNIYQKYQIGDTFSKEMYIGKWNILYSIN